MKKVVACLIVLVVAAGVALGVVASKNGSLKTQLADAQSALTASEGSVKSLTDQAAAAAGGRLESVRVGADRHRIPGILAPGGGIAVLRELGAAFQSAEGEQDAAADIEFVAAFGVGVERHFRTAGAYGIDDAALDIHIAVGVNAVVAG